MTPPPGSGGGGVCRKNVNLLLYYSICDSIQLYMHHEHVFKIFKDPRVGRGGVSGWGSFLFDSLRPLNNLSVMRDGSSWVEPVLS